MLRIRGLIVHIMCNITPLKLLTHDVNVYVDRCLQRVRLHCHTQRTHNADRYVWPVSRPACVHQRTREQIHELKSGVSPAGASIQRRTESRYRNTGALRRADVYRVSADQDPRRR